MVNRRVFLEGLMGTGFLSLTPGPLVACINFMADRAIHSFQTVKAGRRDRRIFCQIKNHDLETEIERCASDIGCEVFHGEPSSPDIFVIGGFIV